MLTDCHAWQSRDCVSVFLELGNDRKPYMRERRSDYLHKRTEDKSCDVYGLAREASECSDCFVIISYGVQMTRDFVKGDPTTHIKD